MENQRDKPHFVPPPTSVYDETDGRYNSDARTYAEYNYLRPGIAAAIKRRHFDAALQLSRGRAGHTDVIDAGCADGIFLPSLSRYFGRVVGFERDADFARLARRVVERLRLDNVTVLHNPGGTVDELRAAMPSGRYDLLFLLEVIEHVGTREHMYEDKVEFMCEASELLHADGEIIMSVPHMVGPSFLLQRLGLWLTRSRREPISLHDLERAVVHADTDALEADWEPEKHLGFNHRKLERTMRTHFDLRRRKRLLFQTVYLLRRSHRTARRLSRGDGPPTGRAA